MHYGDRWKSVVVIFMPFSSNLCVLHSTSQIKCFKPCYTIKLWPSPLTWQYQITAQTCLLLIMVKTCEVTFAEFSNFGGCNRPNMNTDATILSQKLLAGYMLHVWSTTGWIMLRILRFCGKIASTIGYIWHLLIKCT